MDRNTALRSLFTKAFRETGLGFSNSSNSSALFFRLSPAAPVWEKPAAAGGGRKNKTEPLLELETVVVDGEEIFW